MDSDSSSDEGKMQIDVERCLEREPSPAPAAAAEAEAVDNTVMESRSSPCAKAEETTDAVDEEEETGSEDESGEEDDDEDEDEGDEEDEEDEEDEDAENDDDEEEEEEEEEDQEDDQSLMVEEADNDEPICAICYGLFTSQDVGSPESCDHTFCLECILAWSKRVNTCPVDRSVFNLVFARHAGEEKIYKEIAVEDKSQQEEEEEEEEDDEELANTFCMVCGQGDREDTLLLCDGCDRGFHCECLSPQLSEVPVNEWFCPGCQEQNAEVADEEWEEELHLSRRRQIPRTIASERVRASIRQARLARSRVPEELLSSDEEEEELEEPSTSAGATEPRRPAARKKTAKKRKTSKRRKTSKKRKTRKTGLKKTTKKKGRRRRKRKTSRKARLISQRRVSETTPRQRIFRSLGLSKPPTGRTIPLKKQAGDKPVDLGVSLSIFGSKDDLHSYQDETPMPEPGACNLPASRSRVSKYSASALRSHRPVGRPNIAARAPTPPKEETDSAPAGLSSSLSLLDSIIHGQDMLHLHSQHVTINRDGSLRANRSLEQNLVKKMDSKTKEDSDKYLTFSDTPTFGEKTTLEKEEAVGTQETDVRLVTDMEDSAPCNDMPLSTEEAKKEEGEEENVSNGKGENVSQHNCDTERLPEKEESTESLEEVSVEPQDVDFKKTAEVGKSEDEEEDGKPEEDEAETASSSDREAAGESRDTASPAQNDSQQPGKSDGEIESSDSNQYVDAESSQPTQEDEDEAEPSRPAVAEEDDARDNNGEEGQVLSEEEERVSQGPESEDPESKVQQSKENMGDIRKVVISSREDSQSVEPWHKESLLVKVEVKGEEGGEEEFDEKEVQIVEEPSRKSPTPDVYIISDSDEDKDKEERPKVPISELPRIPKRKKLEEGPSAGHSRGVLSRLDLDPKDYRSWEKRKSKHDGDREGRERSRGESRRHRDRSREDRHAERTRDEEGRHRHRRSERRSSRGRSYDRREGSGERERDRDRERERHRSKSRERSHRRRHDRHERSGSRDHERPMDVERESRHKRKKRDRDRSRDREEHRSRRSRSRSRSPRRRGRSAVEKESREQEFYEKQNSSGSGRSEESHSRGSRRRSSEPLTFHEAKKSKMPSPLSPELSPEKDVNDSPEADDDYDSDVNLRDCGQEEQDELSDGNHKSSSKSASPPPERSAPTASQPAGRGEPAEYDPAHPTEEDLERSELQAAGAKFVPRSAPPDLAPPPSGDQAPLLVGGGEGGMISPQNIPLPGMAFGMLPPGLPPGARPQMLVNPVLLNRPPPFRQFPPQVHGPPSRFGWAPGLPVPVRNQFPGQPLPPPQPRMGGLPPQPGMMNGGLDSLGQDRGLGGPPPHQLPGGIGAKGDFSLPPPPGGMRGSAPGDKPSPHLEEITKLLNMQSGLAAFGKKSAGKDDSLFKVPLPPQTSWKSSGTGAGRAGSGEVDPMESTEVVDMDMSPLDDECELELPGQGSSGQGGGAGRGSDGPGNLSKKLVNDLGKAIEKLSARQDDMPSSAVDLTNHQKYLEKVHVQERVVEEVKMAIKPFYASKVINKLEYKSIMRKAVPKICRCKSGRINPQKVKKLVEAYVEKFRKTRAQASGGGKERKGNASHRDAVKANGERQKPKPSR